MITLSFKSSENMNERLEKICEEKGMTKSSIMKLAINNYLDQQDTLRYLGGDTQQLIKQLEKLSENLQNQEKKVD